MFWKKIMLLVLSLHIFIVIVQAQDTRNFKLQISLVNFMNANCMDCFSSTTFCLRERDITTLVDSCPLRVQFDIDDFEPGDMIVDASSGSTVTNPFSFLVLEGTYQLAVKIHNTADNSMADFSTVNIDVQVTGAEMEQMHTGSMKCKISLEYTYQVLCSSNFYKPTCSTFCAPANDSTGHFMCGNNGEMICLPGYTNQSPGGGEGGGVGEGRCTVCDPSSRVCEDSPDEKIASEAPDGNATRNDLEASRENLSDGAVTGIVLSLLIVIAIGIVGSVVGALLWKYQPWEANNTAISEAKPGDALNNPIYELGSMPYSLMRGNQQQVAGHQMTLSVESSPLYSSQSAGDNATPRSQFMENHGLLSVLHISKSRSQEPIGPSAKGGEGRSFGDKSISRSAMNLTENQDDSGNAIVAVKINPYESYVEDSSFPSGTAAEEPDYVGSPTFDDPNYDNVSFD